MKRSTRIFIVFAILALIAAGCGSPKRVTRTSADTTTDLSGRWNDTDSRLVSQEMITDMVAQGWLSDWTSKNSDKGKPTVITGNIINKSHEHISVETFVKDIQRAMINSGKIRFVSSKQERKEVRSERMDQQGGHTSEDSRSGMGAEIGADFMLKGSIKTILDEIGGQKVVFYQVDLELHNIATNDIVWIGQKKIKKIIEKSSTKW